MRTLVAAQAGARGPDFADPCYRLIEWLIHVSGGLAQTIYLIYFSLGRSFSTCTCTKDCLCFDSLLFLFYVFLTLLSLLDKLKTKNYILTIRRWLFLSVWVCECVRLTDYLFFFFFPPKQRVPCLPKRYRWSPNSTTSAEDLVPGWMIRIEVVQLS